jgi:hypothetical protein
MKVGCRLRAEGLAGEISGPGVLPIVRSPIYWVALTEEQTLGGMLSIPRLRRTRREVIDPKVIHMPF